MTQLLRWGFGLSPDALPLLRRLLSAGLIDRLALPPEGEHWPAGALPAFLEQAAAGGACSWR